MRLEGDSVCARWGRVRLRRGRVLLGLSNPAPRERGPLTHRDQRGRLANSGTFTPTTTPQAVSGGLLFAMP